jgi:chromosome segregation ATPase
MSIYLETELARLVMSIRNTDERLSLYRAEIFRENVNISANEILLSKMNQALRHMRQEGTIPLLKEYKNIHQEIAVLNNKISLAQQIIIHTQNSIERLEKDKIVFINRIEQVKKQLQPRPKVVSIKGKNG